MKKFFKLGKRMMALFIVVLININSYAAVGANDGSEFVIVYQDSIKLGVLSISEKSPLNYSYGVPVAKGWSIRSDFGQGSAADKAEYVSDLRITYNGGSGSKAYKTLIDNLWYSDSNTSLSTAAWAGYYECVDTIALAGNDFNTTYNGISSLPTATYAAYEWRVIKNSNLFASANALAYMMSTINSTTKSNPSLATGMQIQAVSHDYDLQPTYKFVSVLKPYDYDLFSNKDRDYNWGYDGQHKDNFDKFGAPAWNNKTNVYSSYRDDTFKKMLGTISLELHYKQVSTAWTANSTSRSNQAVGAYYYELNKTGWVPCVGFETTYVLWVSKRPFDLTGHPDDDSNCIELEGVNKASGCNKGYSIVEGKATLKTQKMADDCYLYLKWGINAATKADIGGGILIPAKTGQVTSE